MKEELSSVTVLRSAIVGTEHMSSWSPPKFKSLLSLFFFIRKKWGELYEPLTLRFTIRAT
jgi:hypothetical protein